MHPFEVVERACIVCVGSACNALTLTKHSYTTGDCTQSFIFKIKPGVHEQRKLHRDQFSVTVSWQKLHQHAEEESAQFDLPSQMTSASKAAHAWRSHEPSRNRKIGMNRCTNPVRVIVSTRAYK